MFCVERLGLIEASTKSGKTVSAIAWIVEQALKGREGQNFWWVAPGYNQAEIAYRRIKLGLTKGAFTPFDTPTPRIAMVNGTWIWFKSADNSDALYGEDVYAAVIDEASRVGESSWHAVRSTLTATRGPIRIIGNVKGRKNWFFDLCRRAESLMISDPDPRRRNMHYAKITADDAVSAGVLDAEEIEDARATLPEKIFRELYYAEPGDDTGNPFGLQYIRACAETELAAGPVVAWGLDLAKSQDWFVCIGLNELGQVAAFHRWRGLPWRQSIMRVWRLVGEDTKVLVDSTGVGDPVLEELQVEHGNFHGYHFTQTSKQKLMEGLAVAIQSGKIAFPHGEIVRELEMFEYKYTRTGVSYSAPEGQHDDCVCALALARQAWAETAPGTNLMKFYETQHTRAVEAQRKNDPIRQETREHLRPLAPERQEIVDNELNDLYEEVLRKTIGRFDRRCVVCGEEVNGTRRVTDGERFWHVGCAGGADAQRSPIAPLGVKSENLL
jgi:hypothetical protein